MTTKKVARTIVWNPEGKKGYPQTATTEHRFQFDPTGELALAEWETEVEKVGIGGLSNIYDTPTAVLSDSDGGYFAIRSEYIVSAKVTIQDGLDT
jgi:hypothetical protein